MLLYFNFHQSHLREYDVTLTTFTVNLTKMKYNKICQVPIDN